MENTARCSTSLVENIASEIIDHNFFSNQRRGQGGKGENETWKVFTGASMSMLTLC